MLHLFEFWNRVYRQTHFRYIIPIYIGIADVSATNAQMVISWWFEFHTFCLLPWDKSLGQKETYEMQRLLVIWCQIDTMIFIFRPNANLGRWTLPSMKSDYHFFIKIHLIYSLEVYFPILCEWSYLLQQSVVRVDRLYMNASLTKHSLECLIRCNMIGRQQATVKGFGLCSNILST